MNVYPDQPRHVHGGPGGRRVMRDATRRVSHIELTMCLVVVHDIAGLVSCEGRIRLGYLSEWLDVTDSWVCRSKDGIERDVAMLVYNT